MKPSERRVKRQRIDAEKACVQRWKDAVSKFAVGTLPYRKACDELAKAEDRLAYLQGE